MYQSDHTCTTKQCVCFSVLKVEEVYHDRESFRPIEVDNDYIMLPSELFSELTEPGSFQNA